MSWKPVLLSISLLLADVFGAAINQQTLRVDSFDSRLEYSISLARLRASVGDHLFEASPVAKPCYSWPGPFSQDQCDIVEKWKTNDTWISDQPGGYFYGNWASCQAMAQTCAIPLNTSGEIPVNATCFQGSVPDQMINVSSIEHIQAAFKFAQDTKRPLVIKNTGHDWKGRSSAPGSLALWTHNLRSPWVPIVLNRNFKPLNCTNHPQETVLHFGAGETWAGAYKFAEDNDLAVLGGTCGTVGIAGWLHGGGHSPLTPVYGMGVDNVRQIEIVTPRGEVKTANECLNKDLFFAVRGGGGGTFGVVTNITYKALLKFEIQEFSANLTGLNNATMREFFEIVTSQAILWSQKGWGGYLQPNASKGYIKIVNPNSTLDDARIDMVPIISFLKANNLTYILKTHPSWYDYYQKNFKPAEKHPGASSRAVASRLLPSYVFDHQIRSKLVDRLLTLSESNLYLWLMLVTPTKFPHTNTSALHPSWKDAIWSVRVNGQWDQFYDRSTPEASRKHFQCVHQAMEPVRKLAPDMGVSLNEADIWEENHKLAFWGGDNYEKLAKIKSDVDPLNVLSTYAAVGWDEGADRYKCYPKQIQ